MSDTRKTINIEPHDVEVECGDGQFVLIFLATNYKIKLHFSRWWIPFIARELWKFIKHEREQIAHVEDGMKEAKP